MKNIYITLFTLFVTTISFGQLQRAERYFQVGDFKNAAKNYQLAFKKDNSREILTKIIDCYYYDQDYQNAFIYLKQLVNVGNSEYDNGYNMKMYQVLNNKDQTGKGLEYLKLYYKNKGIPFNKEEALVQIIELQKRNPKFNATKSTISSEADDFGPVRVGDSIFFTSDRSDEVILKSLFEKRFKSTARPFLDIYSARVNDKNEISGQAIKLGQSINSGLHDGNFCFNESETEMYLSRSAYNGDDQIFDEANTNRVHLYKSKRKDGIWENAERLPFVKDQYSYMHPTLTSDGKRLYFSSDMEGGLGSFDIYYVTINPDGTYTAPINLGATINTAEREQFPYVSETGDLYFASDGHLGLGLLDIYVVPFTSKGFIEPINLGAPINSKYDDFSLTYYSDTNGLFATNRNGLDDDIYSFVQTNDLIQREFDIKIEVRDAVTNNLIPNASVKILGDQGREVYSNSKVAPSSFSVPLAVDDYTIIAFGENYDELRVDIQVRGDDNKLIVIKLNQIFTEEELALMKEKDLPKDLKDKDPSRFELLTDPQAPQVVEKDGVLFIDVAPIYFDFDLSEIREDSQIVLDQLAAKLIKYKRIKMKIQSHTDSRGPEAYNIPLSERRAKSTFDYLVSKGIAPERVAYKGYGNSKPVVDCPIGKCSEEDHQLNRRSEFEITEY